MVKPHSSNFRVITTNVLGVWKLRIITVYLVNLLKFNDLLWEHILHQVLTLLIWMSNVSQQTSQKAAYFKVDRTFGLIRNPLAK